MIVGLRMTSMITFEKYVKADYHLTATLPFAIEVQRDITFRAPPIPDVHYDLHLGILTKGRFRIIYNDFTCDLAPGEVWWTSCWEPHTGLPLEDGSELTLVTVSPEHLGNLDIFRGASWLTSFLAPIGTRPQAHTKRDRQTVLKFAAELEALSATTGDDRRLLCWMKIHEMILFLRRHWTPPKAVVGSDLKNEFMRILPAIERVRTCPADAINLDEAASVCDMSRSRFCTLFREIMGEPFKKFVVRAHLSGAARELAATEKPLKIIGPEWGFADNAHFAHAFHKFFGCSPISYRNKAKHKV